MEGLLNQLLQGMLLFLVYLLIGVVLFLIFYYLASALLTALIWRLLRYRARLRGEPMTEQRAVTLRSLTQSLMNALSGILTVIFLLSQVLEPGTLATTIGLFSAGLGIAARPFISDVLGGIVLLFEDQFALGEKVEIGDRNVVGVVERVSLRTTHIRGDMGELWIVPNGDVRTIRNFSRGSFSPANIRLTLPTADFDEALAILQRIAETPGPDVIGRPEVISEDGQIGETTSLLLKVKARHGAGPEVRRELLLRLQALLAEHRLIAQARVAGPAESNGAPMEARPATDDGL